RRGRSGGWGRSSSGLPAEAEGLAESGLVDPLVALEVGDGAGDAEHAVEGTGAELEAVAGDGEQAGGGGSGVGCRQQEHAVEVGVEMGAGLGRRAAAARQ